MTGTIVVPYDPAWAELFAEEQARLAAVLAPWLEGGIHHIGSTAVPGLPAKPIVDMMAGVRDLEEARAAFAPLARLGYVHHPHRPEADRFARMAWQTPLGATHHLHLTVPGSDLWRERLAFRDALLTDPTLRAEYAAWKRAHVSPDLPAGTYTADKRPLVARVLAERGIPLRPDEERLDPALLAERAKRT